VLTEGCACSTSISTSAPALGRFFDHAGETSELPIEVLLGVEAAVDGEPRRAWHDVEAGAGAGPSADHEHRTGRVVAFDREARALLEQLVGE
jgi:hypothetical protein